MRLNTLQDIEKVLDKNPDIDTAEFWNHCDIDVRPMIQYGRKISIETGVNFGIIMAAMESGATLAIRDKL